MTVPEQRMRNISFAELGKKNPAFIRSKLFNGIIEKLLNFIKYVDKYAVRIAMFIFKLGKPETSCVKLKETLISTDDGALMATDIFVPKETFETRGKAPTILVRLPYWKLAFGIFGYVLARLGYVTILQDIRGSASSIDHGTNSFFLSETADGIATLNWIKKRFWYNGKMGMWGPSYLGMTQLTLSLDNNGSINCLVPSIISYSSMFHHDGGLTTWGIQSSVYCVLIAITRSKRLVLDNSEMDFEKYVEKLVRSPIISMYNEPLNSNRYLLDIKGLKELDIKEKIKKINQKFNLNLNISKKDDGSFQKLIKFIFYDRKLRINHEYLPTVPEYDFSKLKTPILMVGGWYDMFSDYILHDFNVIMKNAPEETKRNFKLIMGPWAHANVGHPDHLQDVAGLPGFIKEIIPIWWYDYWLKNEESDMIRSPPLKIYVMGKNVWRYLNEWPPKESEFVKYYLHSKGNANSRFGDGLLSQIEPKNEPSDKYDFNPMNPVITNGGNNLDMTLGAKDQRKTEKRTDILVYTSEPLKKSIEVTGKIQLIFYATSSAKDTDFMAKLVDVYPNEKKAINILDNGIRARYRNYDLENPSFIEPNKIYEYTINLGSTSIYFKKNHRIRLEISSSNFPKYDINSNLAGEKNKKGYKIARQEIFHDFEHPSYLILPIYPSKTN
ncbi:MAG: CocE/NonD family hydrolase [Candidatus Lokiarchaeota archaeon]|nr:CocE/NonD family hydrolase [Candidatus Lokiarchaeota archaeon]